MSLIRRAIIAIAELLALVFVVASTIAGYTFGTRLAPYIQSGPDVGAQLEALGRAAPIGGITGLFISILITASFFALVEIAHNTRKE